MSQGMTTRVWDAETKRFVSPDELTQRSEQPTEKRKKVAIVGFASHWNQAPYEDPEFEVWSLNEAYDLIPWAKAAEEKRLRWFEIHGREEHYEGNPFFHSRNNSNEHAAKLAALGCPVYMQRAWDDIPNSVEYPYSAMRERFGDYFTNSISWMLALAIHEGFKEIHIYGVDMAQGTEYASQRPSCEYFLGILKAMGIRVYLPSESDLCKAAYMYGWEQPKAERFLVKLSARKDELQKRLNMLVNQRAQIEAAINQIQGAIENSNYMQTAWVGK